MLPSRNSSFPALIPLIMNSRSTPYSFFAVTSLRLAPFRFHSPYSAILPSALYCDLCLSLVRLGDSGDQDIEGVYACTDIWICRQWPFFSSRIPFSVTSSDAPKSLIIRRKPCCQRLLST